MSSPSWHSIRLSEVPPPGLVPGVSAASPSTQEPPGDGTGPACGWDGATCWPGSQLPDRSAGLAPLSKVLTQALAVLSTWPPATVPFPRPSAPPGIPEGGTSLEAAVGLYFSPSLASACVLSRHGLGRQWCVYSGTHQDSRRGPDRAGVHQLSPGQTAREAGAGQTLKSMDALQEFVVFSLQPCRKATHLSTTWALRRRPEGSVVGRHSFCWTWPRKPGVHHTGAFPDQGDCTGLTLQHRMWEPSRPRQWVV